MKGYKRRYKKKFNTFGLIYILVAGAVLMLTVGYSAFQVSLEISDMSVVVAPEINIMITDVSVDSQSLATVYSTQNSVDGFTSSIDLPNQNSSITYRVEIANLGNVEMGILEITGLQNNLKYDIPTNNYVVTDVICDNTNANKCKLGARKTLYITIEYDTNGYDSESTLYQISLDFSFKQYFTISYEGFNSVSGLPTGILEDEIKEITFNNTTGIPVAARATGALGVYSSPTLTLSDAEENVVVERKHVITYVLGGGTQASNQVTSIYSDETVELLDPSYEGKSFGGWYDNDEFEGDAITSLSGVTSDITLYASWLEVDYYINDAEFNGNVSSVINTGVSLYSEENVNKNFRIAFTINSYDSSYDTASNINSSRPPTIVSSMDESGSPWPGFVFRVVPNKGVSYYSIKINNTNITSYLGYFNLASGIDVEIVREDGAMYVKVNSNIYTKVFEYTEPIDTFDVPVTIGGNINSNGAYDRVFNGELSNVTVDFYEGSIVNNYSYTESRTQNSYALNGTIFFDGTNYIDTGLNLFSSQNITKDFDIEFTLDEMGVNENQATLVNAKDESKNTYPGFAYRLDSSGKMTFTSRWPGQSNTNYGDSVTTPKTIRIYRRNQVVYYTVNGGTQKTFTPTPASSLTDAFNRNLTFGASLDSSGAPFRYFKGIVSNISVTISEPEP